MFSYISSSFNKIINSILTSVLKNGICIPKIIGIIMDGNRRYSKKHNFKTIQGHTDGMETLFNFLQWSMQFEIKELTVFAFSVDNFNRNEKEINDLITLFKESFYKYMQKKEKNHDLGVKICIYGNWSFFDEEMQKIFKDIEEKTKNNNLLKLNVCIGYNFTEELHHVRQSINDKAENLKNEFESKLYGGYNCNPDLLIRTSGETRLSNYLLYQCRFSMIMFLDKYWPELSFFDFCKILLKYNYNYTSHREKLKSLEKANNFDILSNKYN